MLPLVFSTIRPNVITLNNSFTLYCDSIFSSFASIDNFYVLIQRLRWDIYEAYYKEDKGYAVICQITCNFFGNIVHFFGGYQGSTNDIQVLFGSGIGF